MIGWKKSSSYLAKVVKCKLERTWVVKERVSADVGGPFQVVVRWCSNVHLHIIRVHIKAVVGSCAEVWQSTSAMGKTDAQLRMSHQGS